MHLAATANEISSLHSGPATLLGALSLWHLFVLTWPEYTHSHQQHNKKSVIQFGQLLPGYSIAQDRIPYREGLPLDSTN